MVVNSLSYTSIEIAKDYTDLSNCFIIASVATEKPDLLYLINCQEYSSTLYITDSYLNVTFLFCYLNAYCYLLKAQPRVGYQNLSLKLV